MEESDLILPASAREVTLRLARPDERVRWDALMDERHYLGFRQFAGRGLRYVAEYQKQWLALIGRQSGAFKCRPRDRWIGWRPQQQFPRLRLIANNTRMLLLCPPRAVHNLASCVMAANLRHLSADWQEAYGHPLELAETFVDPKRFAGTLSSGRKLEGGRAHPRLFPQQRPLHPAPRPHQDDGASIPCAPERGNGCAIPSRAPPGSRSGRRRCAPQPQAHALVAAGVPGHPGSPSSPGPQVPVAHSAGPLGVGSAVRLPGSRCHLAFCRRAEPGGTAQPRRLAKSQDRSLRPSLSGHPASSDDRHRPQAVSIGPSALGGAPATCPHRSGGRRQTSAGRQSSRRRPLPARGKSRHGIRPGLHPGGLRCSSVTYSRYAPSERLVRRAQPRSRCSRDFHHGLLRNRVSGSPRQRDAHRQPPLHRRGGRDCGRPGPAGGGRCPRRGDHSGRLAHHPQHPPRPPASPGAPTICSRSRATRPKPTKPWRPSTGTGTPLPASPKTPSRPMAASKIAGSRS